jgi:hypothetical protein
MISTPPPAHAAEIESKGISFDGDNKKPAPIYTGNTIRAQPNQCRMDRPSTSAQPNRSAQNPIAFNDKEENGSQTIQPGLAESNPTPVIHRAQTTDTIRLAD